MREKPCSAAPIGSSPPTPAACRDRRTGFEGRSTPPLGTGEPEFPELAALLSQFASPFQHRPACSGPVTWNDWPAAEADIARAKAALEGAGAAEYFMTSPSPD